MLVWVRNRVLIVLIVRGRLYLSRVRVSVRQRVPAWCACCGLGAVPRAQIMPKPSLPSRMAMTSFETSVSKLSAGGSTSELKQVWLCGSVSALP